MSRRRKHWGWGYEDEAPSLSDVAGAAGLVEARLGFAAQEPEAPVALGDAALRAPRALPEPPAGVGWDVSDHARARHAWGSSYLDVVRGLRGRFDHAPDAVARPADEHDVAAVLGWAGGAGVKVVPFGGGTSVVGGVTPAVDDPVVSLDLGRLDRVLEVDRVSRAARVQAGALGPDLEAQLGEHGLTLRCFPQSFQLSTLGGWVATRAGGHFATGPTHIDDLVEAVRAVTPGAGTWASRRLPGSGAGPSPDRLLIGSEGTLGVITEAWVRVQPRPEHRASRGVRFERFELGLEAVRALAQSGLQPANCRLVDAAEAGFTGAGDGRSALLVLGFESTDAPVEADLARGLELCAECGGSWDEPAGGGGSVGAWRDTFLQAPYLRDVLVQLGVLSETFETAITWDRVAQLHATVTEAVRDALADDRALVTCRLTHAYADGAAPYFTVLAPARRGDEEAQWWAVKRAASDALLAGGATITHHHAVGRDHRPWYDQQRPEPFAAALRAAKAAVDPAGVLNPGVLIDP
ncbi:MAG TPA: FAD-binding oxidoreductase [Capillimicrobium sp.]